jgi:hypothetical protein
MTIRAYINAIIYLLVRGALANESQKLILAYSQLIAVTREIKPHFSQVC